jgi:4-hydroxy-3-methylbut-2-enyl diphosphate reductase
MAVCSHGRDVIVVDTPEAASSVVPDRPLLLLSQTTFSLRLFEEISDILKKACEREHLPFVRFNTVCPATGSRQKALERLCGEVDAVLIVGGKNSANTKRLYDSALERLDAVWHIEEASELRADMVRFPRIGITAGASTPDRVIREVVDAIERLEA